MDKLEQEVLDIINEVIDGKYIGKLKVIKFKNSYQLRFYLGTWYTPIILECEGNEDDFKKFIRCEMKSRKFQKSKFYSLTRYPLVPEEELIESKNE